jgi:hypothetical protein
VDLLRFLFLFHNDGRGIWHVWGREKLRMGLWWVSVKERDHLDDLGADKRLI